MGVPTPVAEPVDWSLIIGALAIGAVSHVFRPLVLFQSLLVLLYGGATIGVVGCAPTWKSGYTAFSGGLWGRPVLHNALQTKIAQLRQQGKSIRTIANELKLSTRTVLKYR